MNHRLKLSTAPWEVHSLAAGLVPEPQWTPQNGRGGARISLNHPLAVPGPVQEALLASLGRWGGVPSRCYTVLVRSCGLQQEFITP